MEASRRIPDGHLTLLDIQPAMLQKAAAKLKAAGIDHFDTRQADGQALPFDDETFDAIFMVTVFGEIEGRAPFLAEAHRVLKPDGVLSITEHHPDPDFESAASVAEKSQRLRVCPDSENGVALGLYIYREVLFPYRVRAGNTDDPSERFIDAYQPGEYITPEDW